MTYTVDDLADLIAARQVAWNRYVGNLRSGSWDSLNRTYRRQVAAIDREIRKARRQLEDAGFM